MINIREILGKHKVNILSGEKHINAIKEIIEITLLKAAENASTTQYITNLRTEQYEKEINKQSILNTINEIKF